MSQRPRPMKPDQSYAARLARLQSGCCPLHGQFIGGDSGRNYNIDGSYYACPTCGSCENGDWYCVTCLVEGCGVRFTVRFDAQHEPEFGRLLGPDWLVTAMADTRDVPSGPGRFV